MKNYEEKLKEVMDIQIEMCKELNLSDEESRLYNIGLYNGMALAKAIYIGIEPEFYDGEKIRRKSEDE